MARRQHIAAECEALDRAVLNPTGRSQHPLLKALNDVDIVCARLERELLGLARAGRPPGSVSAPDRATELDHFAWWTQTFLVQSADRWVGKPLKPEAWQRRFMAEALALDEEGLSYWQSVDLVVSRKNGKTAMLAAYVLYRLLNDEGQPEILLAAVADRQAGRLFDADVSYVRQNPELAAQVRVRTTSAAAARSCGWRMTRQRCRTTTRPLSSPTNCMPGRSRRTARHGRRDKLRGRAAVAKAGVHDLHRRRGARARAGASLAG
jgi:hypothetical protein